MSKLKNTSLCYILMSLGFHGNTIITSKALKEIGGKKRLLEELKAEGFNCTIRHAEVGLYTFFDSEETLNKYSDHYVIEVVK